MTTPSFGPIFEAARTRLGAAALEARLPQPRSAAELKAMPDEAVEALLTDARLIRHWGKLKSVRDNAAAMIAVAEEHGSFGAWLADWPPTNIVELWEALAKRFSQMGGNS